MHGDERMGCRKRRVECPEVDQAVQFPYVRQPPGARDRAICQAASPTRQIVRIGQRGEPILVAIAIRVLQPDQSREIVGDSAIAVVRESGGDGNTLLVLAILS